MRVHRVADLDSPALRPFRSLRRGPSDAAGTSDLVIGEGPKVVRRLLRSRLRVRSLLLTPEWLTRLEAEGYLALVPPELEVYVSPDAVLRELVGFHLFQGVLAAAETPPPPQLPALLQSAGEREYWVALDGLTQAENVGAIARSAVGFGVRGLIVGETCSPPWLRRALRSSMGSLLDLEVVRSADLAADLQLLAHHGFALYAADVRGAEDARHVSFAPRGCLVLGSEGHGIRPHVLGVCPHQVRISADPKLESFNVSCAATVLLYELNRQSSSIKS